MFVDIRKIGYLVDKLEMNFNLSIDYIILPFFLSISILFVYLFIFCVNFILSSGLLINKM